MAAIEILGITKSYPVGFFRHKLRTALQPLTLKVEEGETFGFLGPNGAGKTTTSSDITFTILKSKSKSAFCPSSRIFMII